MTKHRRVPEQMLSKTALMSTTKVSCKCTPYVNMQDASIQVQEQAKPLWAEGITAFLNPFCSPSYGCCTGAALGNGWHVMNKQHNKVSSLRT